MKDKMNRSLNNGSKKTKIFLFLSIIIFAIALGVGTYAYYVTTITGNVSGTVLAWDCSNQSGTLTNALTNLYPGVSGSFALKVKSTNFVTDVTVDLIYDTSGNVPPNFKLYKESSHTNVVPVSIFDPSKATSGKYVRSDTGELKASTYWYYSDYITIVGGRTYYFEEANVSTTVAGSAWYDANKNFISGFTATALANAGNKYTAPANAKYLRHSFSAASGANTNWEETVRVYEGTTDLTPAFSQTGLAANTTHTFNIYYYWPIGTEVEEPIATGTDDKGLTIKYRITCTQAQ